MSAPGIYRAKVIAPFQSGSCLVVIPQLFGDVQVPVSNFVSSQVPLDMPVGWVMFEGGDESRPVWIGVDTSPVVATSLEARVTSLEARVTALHG